VGALTNVHFAFPSTKILVLRSGFLGGEFSEYDVSVTFTTDSRMRALNFAYRGRAASTDILTFRLADPPAATASDIAAGLPEMPGKLLPGAPYLCAETGKQLEAQSGPWHLPKDLGDVFVNVQHSCRTASSEQVSLGVYIPVVITHGLAHDQEAYCNMKKAEREALALLRRTHNDSAGLLDYAIHQTSSLESYLP
jgi:ssRNA-specific RNase YbeY (16S rRNA maturation enzyme)